MILTKLYILYLREITALNLIIYNFWLKKRTCDFGLMKTFFCRTVKDIMSLRKAWDNVKGKLAKGEPLQGWYHMYNIIKVSQPATLVLSENTYLLH